MIDLFILCVDRDGIAGRKQQLEEIERQAARVLGERSYLLAENACGVNQQCP